MSSQVIVGVSGAINSGKSTFSRSLATRLDAGAVHFGHFVKSIATEKGLGTERSALQKVGAQLLSDLGPTQFVDAALTYCGCENQKNLVFDGVRHVEVWHAIQERFNNGVCVLISLEVSDDIRRQRTSTENIHALSGYDEHSTERQVGNELRVAADVRLEAEMSVDAMVEITFGFLSRRT